MYLGLSIEVQCKSDVSLRQSIEARLEPTCMAKATISLKLYKEREDLYKKAYKRSMESGMVKRYKKHGLEFEYACVYESWLPSFDCDVYGHGLAHCLYNKLEAIIAGQQVALARGQWMLFVIVDAYDKPMPIEVEEYAAVHEAGEMFTLMDHNLASKLEFNIAKKEKKLMWYMGWIERNCPAKLADIFTYQIYATFPEDEKFQEALEEFEFSRPATQVRRMTEDFEWPYKLLQKLSKYDKMNAKIEQIIYKAMDFARILASGGATMEVVFGRITTEVPALLMEIAQNELTQYVSYPRIQDKWQFQRKQVNDAIAEFMAKQQKSMSLEVYAEKILKLDIDGTLPRIPIFSADFREVIKFIEDSSKT